ncbi:MAG: hypothetical protein U0531_20855 [Dehalococcoidia bacterium]
MAADPQPGRMDLADLCRRCRDEIERYRAGNVHDDRYCFELLRRAIAERDEAAWREMHATYDPQVRAWCRRAAAESRDDVDEVAALAWEKFWHSYTAVKLAGAGGSGEALRYLQMCARSAVIDLARKRQSALPLDLAAEQRDPAPSPADDLNAEAARREFWEVVRRHLRDEREQALVMLAYELGLKSAQVQARRPDLFPSVHDVYRITRNLLDRLRRSPDLRSWLRDQEAC